MADRFDRFDNKDDRKCCRSFPRGVLLVMAWNLLNYTTFKLMYYTLLLALPGNYQHIFTIVYFTLWIVVPLTGWLGDAYIGRYRAIIFGFLLSQVAILMFLIAFILLKISWTPVALAFTVLCIGLLIGAVGYGSIFINQLPFLLDQMLGATGEQLSAAAHWYYWTYYVGQSVFVALFCVPVWNTPFQFILSDILYPIIGISCFTAILALDCLCHKWLDTNQKLNDYIKLIYQVLNYARKTKYPRQRSAFTYIDEEQPSRLDFGKDKFGGPFTEEEVEDVKTVLHLLPILISLVGAVLSLDTHGPFQRHLIPTTNQNRLCATELKKIIYNSAAVLLIPAYRFILHPLLHRYIPSMLRRIGAGLFLCFMSTVMTLTLDTVGHLMLHSNTSHCMFDTSSTYTLPIPLYWLLITDVVCGLGTAIVACSLIEFLVAQTPNRMRGFMVGLWTTTFGIIEVANTVIQLPFHYIPSVSPSCGFYYYLLLSVLTMTTLVLFVVLAKRYKLRVRGIHVNIQAIAEEHYERYFDQEEEYLKESTPDSIYD